MTSAGVVLGVVGSFKNSHSSPSGHTRHSRRTACHATNMQVNALSPDLAEALALERGRTAVTTSQ